MNPERYIVTNLVREGKTKKVWAVEGKEGLVILESKDDITAGDGAKHDIVSGKAALANQTTCNAFRLLKTCGLPVAFVEAIPDANTFLAPQCQMLPYEVVVRREAHGSYLKRAPHLARGHLFPRLVLELFLKTSGKQWKEHCLPCDDPYMVHDAETREVRLYDPKQPNLAQHPATPFLTLPEAEVFSQDDEQELIRSMGNIARKTFLVLEKAWQLQRRKLVDFKVEFGVADGELLLADVIDNDSWRVVDDSGRYYRQAGLSRWRGPHYGNGKISTGCGVNRSLQHSTPAAHLLARVGE